MKNSDSKILIIKEYDYQTFGVYQTLKETLWIFFFVSKDYDEDFENFEDELESDHEIKKSFTKTKNNNSEEDYEIKGDIKKPKQKSKSSENVKLYQDGKVIRANANVVIPTENVIVLSSKVFFNHDSQDRQKRRAKDLFKTIELDKKSFSLLDINPLEMRTVYSAHLQHVNIFFN